MNIFVPQLSKERKKSNVLVSKLLREQRKIKLFVPQPSKEKIKTNVIVPKLSKE